MNTYTATLLLETGALRTLNVMAPTAHEARRIVAGWIGNQHPDAVKLVSLGALDTEPRHRVESHTAERWLEMALVTAGLLVFLFLLLTLFH